MALTGSEHLDSGFVRDGDQRLIVTGPGSTTSGSTAGALTANPSRPATAKTAKGKFTAKAESKVLVAANENRIALYVTCVGTGPVFLALGEPAAAEEGIALWEKGSAVIDNYSGPVTIITKTGESVVAFAEV
jgi:hypothetical protein